MPDTPAWPPCLGPDRRATLAAYGIDMPEQIRGLMGTDDTRAQLAALVGLTDAQLGEIDAWLVAVGLDPADRVPAGPVQFDFEEDR